MWITRATSWGKGCVRGYIYYNYRATYASWENGTNFLHSLVSMSAPSYSELKVSDFFLL